MLPEIGPAFPDRHFVAQNGHIFPTVNGDMFKQNVIFAKDMPEQARIF